MATIQVKRGTSKPTTSNLTNTGEFAFNYSSNELYIRGSSSVIKMNTLEEVFYYEGLVSSYKLALTFDPKYVYQIHIVCSTNGTDTSDTTMNYYNTSGTLCGGASACMRLRDNYTGVYSLVSRSLTTFTIYDGYSNSVSASYATTKVIDIELSPTQESGLGSTYSWTAQGKSTCCSSDHTATPITFAVFSHAVDVGLGSILFNPGLDGGSTDTFAITVTRYRRRA